MTEEAKEPEFKIMLQIVIGKDGQMGISGLAMKDEILAYGIIEKAKLIIKSMYEPKVVRPQTDFLQSLRNGGKH